MIKINEGSKSMDDLETQVPSGIWMTFENGNTISIQFGWGNYSSNREESHPEATSAEIAIWNTDNKWYEFEQDTVKGWCDADEVAKWIYFASTTEI